MNTIHKYTLHVIRGLTEIQIPQYQHFLDIQFQDDHIVVWVEVNDGFQYSTKLSFFLAWTGDDTPAGYYVKTIQQHNNGLVVHVYSKQNINHIKHVRYGE